MGHKNLHNTDVAGYVEVADEPLHKEVYADRYFRAYLATLTPGQATCYHRHSEDTLYFVIKGGRMSTTNLKGYKRSPIVFPQSFPFYKKLWLALQNVFTGAVHLPEGLFFFMPTKKHPSVHLAAASPRNRDEVCLMGIEMRHSSANHPPFVHDSLPWRAEYDDGSFMALVCNLAPAASDRIVMPDHHLFLVCRKGLLEILSEHDPKGKSELRPLAMGDYLCISGESPALARNPGNEASELLILAIQRDGVKPTHLTKILPSCPPNSISLVKTRTLRGLQLSS